ncbi:MAG TPA: response regulator transcription factor [Solirubrobacteraceae bacterium]|nr:response regulator transcription factor [Solirubrobacteraceae bacterium]
MRLALAADEELMLEALERLFASAGLEVVARCTTAAEIARAVRTCGPDVVLIDTALADGGGIAELIRPIAGSTRIVLLASRVDCELARQTIDLALDGVVLKCAGAASVVAALGRIADGDAVFPAGWLAAARRAPAPIDETLSPRQRDVLELLAQGLPNDVIADRLYISRNTVKFHVAAIYQRLGVHNRVEAAHTLSQLRAAS